MAQRINKSFLFLVVEIGAESSSVDASAYAGEVAKSMLDTKGTQPDKEVQFIFKARDLVSVQRITATAGGNMDIKRVVEKIWYSIVDGIKNSFKKLYRIGL